MNSQQRLLLYCTIYSSNNHHNIAVNVILHLSLKEKYTVNPTWFNSTATRKVPENPETEAIHSHLSCPFIYTADTQEWITHNQSHQHNWLK